MHGLSTERPLGHAGRRSPPIGSQLAWAVQDTRVCWGAGTFGSVPTHSYGAAQDLPGRNRPAACPLLFDEWFHRDDFEACSFINVLLEMGRAHPAGEASVEHLANIRAVVRRLAEEAALRDPDSFAHSWHILMKGSIVSATEGDAEAAQRARSMANLLIERHR